MRNQHVRVLLVEDDEDDFLIIRDLLREAFSTRYHIDWVSTYVSALDKIGRLEHDVYLIDYRLDGKRNGVDLLREALRIRCEAPFIIVTAHGEHELDIEALEAGASDYLVKGSITADVLDRSIRYSIKQKKAEEALRESEDRFRQIFERSLAAKLLVDPETGIILHANPAAFRFYGYAPNELIGMEIFHINTLAPDELSDKMARAAAEEINHFYFQHRLASGEIRDVEIYSSPIDFKGKKLLHSIVHDITERRIAERGLEVHAKKLKEANRELSRAFEELRISEHELIEQNKELIRTRNAMNVERERYLELFEHAPDGYLVTDDSGAILEVNSAAENLLGMARKTLIGKSLASFVPKNSRNAFEKKLTELRERRQIKDWQISIRQRGGKTFDVEINATCMSDPRFSSDGISRWIVRDISRRKQAENQVDFERQRLFSLLDSLPAYVFLMAPDYSIRFANRYFRERFGDPGGEPCYDLLPGCMGPCEVCPSQTVIKTNQSMHWEWTHVATGKTYQIYGYPFTDIDGSPLVLELGIDISERVRAEQALRESREGLKHLSSRLLSVQEEERKRVAQEIHDSIGQLLAALKYAVENVIVAKERGNIEGFFELLEGLVPTVQEAIEEVRRIYMSLRPTILDDLGILPTIAWYCREFTRRHPGVSLEKNIDVEEADIPGELKIVIFRIVQEALTNIAKHSNAESATLSLLRKQQEIQLLIKDDGTGFDVSLALSGENGNRGLGIASMKERAELTGGMFQIESVSGKGTAIEFSWPSGNES